MLKLLFWLGIWEFGSKGIRFERWPTGCACSKSHDLFKQVVDMPGDTERRTPLCRAILKIVYVHDKG